MLLLRVALELLVQRPVCAIALRAKMDFILILQDIVLPVPLFLIAKLVSSIVLLLRTRSAGNVLTTTSELLVERLVRPVVPVVLINTYRHLVQGLQQLIHTFALAALLPLAV